MHFQFLYKTTYELKSDVTTPQTIEMTVNIVFRVAEKECLLFDPKPALKRAFSRFFKNHLRTPLKSDVTTPQTIEMNVNIVFRVAEKENS